MKEATVMIRVFATVAIDMFTEVDNSHPIEELPQIVDEFRSDVSNKGILAAIDFWGGEFEVIDVKREPEVRDFEAVNEQWMPVDELIDEIQNSDWYNEDDSDPDEEVSDDAGDDEGNTADISQEAATRLFQSLLTF